MDPGFVVTNQRWIKIKTRSSDVETLKCSKQRETHLRVFCTVDALINYLQLDIKYPVSIN